MIQNRQHTKLIQQKKNRFDGDLLTMRVGFKKDVKTFVELEEMEFNDLEGGYRTMSQILEIREVMADIV